MRTIRAFPAGFRHYFVWRDPLVLRDFRQDLPEYLQAAVGLLFAQNEGGEQLLKVVMVKVAAGPPGPRKERGGVLVVMGILWEEEN